MNQASAATSDAALRYVHLKVHSAYSLLEGAITIPKLAKLAVAHGFPALGLTDTNNLFGALEFADKLADAGVQPIVGCTLQIDFGRAQAGQRRGAHPDRCPCHAVACGRSDSADRQQCSRLPEPDEARLAGVLRSGRGRRTAPASRAPAISGRRPPRTDGRPGRTDRHGSAARPARARRSALEELSTRIFGDRLYVEVQRHGLEHEIATEPELLDLAYAQALPIVATNEVYFASADDYEAHDALLCIADGKYLTEDDRRRVSREHYFKSAAEMAELFADLPEALANTIEIAKRCAFRPKGRKPILPRYVRARADASEAEVLKLETAELRAQAEAGLEQRWAAVGPAPGFTREDYQKRLTFEVDVISKMKYPGYFLIVADFIKWAKSNGIPVGPGRGSGAGSVVAWALTITDLDPLRFGLLFERFLNPERVSMPDFDIDFCQDRRDEVIRYVQQKYGADRVAQIITHGKLQARAVLRDVGRVLQMPYGQVDKLCKLVPNNPTNPVTLPQAIEGEPRLQEARDSDPVVARLLEIAQKLEGLYRHASTHAAGMVIGDRPLDELVPLYRDPKSSFPITQFNWKLVEAAGLVKFDFLGLKTLTVLQKAVALIKRGRGVDIDLATVPLDDAKSYELLAKADTVGVFQLEGTGMRDSLKRLRPDRFEDIIAMVALYRPGPMDNIPTYINRKHGEEPVDCLHRMLEPILKETYGVIIYQEQVMQIAQVMAGFSLGEADLLRRAMGKKDKREMAQQKTRFVEGAVQERRQEGRRGVHLRAGRQVRRLRLQQEPRRSLCARQLPHGLPQGELPRGVPRRLHDPRYGQHRQARHVHGRGEEVRHRHRAALHQRVRGRFSRRRQDHSLLAGSAQEHRRSSGREPGRGAHGEWPLLRPLRLRPPLQHQGSQQAGHRNPLRCRRLRRAGTRSRARARQFRSDAGLCEPHRKQCSARHERPVRRCGRGPAPGGHPPDQGLDADGAAATRVRGGRLLPLRSSPGRLRGSARQAQHDLVCRTRGPGGARCRGGPARWCRGVGARAQIAKGQQVRLRRVLGAHGTVRSRDLFRDAGAEPAAARARNCGAGHRGG